MSRKWSRMVSKNRKTINVQRKKSGSPSLSQSKETSVRFLGRSWILPLLFIGIGIYMLSVNAYYEESVTYKFVIYAYPILGVFMYLVRRPSLRIDLTALTSRRFSGDKKVEAADIDSIHLSKAAIAIRFKGKRQPWVFSRWTHMFPIQEASVKLEEFAQKNQVILQQN